MSCIRRAGREADQAEANAPSTSCKWAKVVLGAAALTGIVLGVLAYLCNIGCISAAFTVTRDMYLAGSMSGVGVAIFAALIIGSCYSPKPKPDSEDAVAKIKAAAAESLTKAKTEAAKALAAAKAETARAQEETAKAQAQATKAKADAVETAAKAARDTGAVGDATSVGSNATLKGQPEDPANEGLF